MRRLAVIAAVLAVAVVAVGGGIAIVRLTELHVPFLSDTCRVYSADDVVRLTPDQLDHAATISAVAASRKLPERAATIALATAMQESKLRNLESGDRDSIGLFQQRPSQGWGTPAQLRDPRYAAGKFYQHLVAIPGWQEMRLTEAAQAVQRSGHPEAYQKWEADAKTLASAFFGKETGAVTCQLREKQAKTGDQAARALLTAFTADIGKLSVTPSKSGNVPQLTVAVGGGSPSTLGWRTAHWFVAKSHQYGVQRVAFDGQVWTAESGKWQRDKSADDAQVKVRVTPSS